MNDKIFNRNHSMLSGLIFAGISAVYLLLFSAYTSPLFSDFVEYDSAIFMMVAKSVLSGKRLFIDIFDHKGPVFFLFEIIGMAGGRTGLYLLQTVFLWADLWLIDRMTGVFLDETAGGRPGASCGTGRSTRMVVIGLTLLFLAYPLSNGNLTEEYSLPFILLSLYLFVKDILTTEEPRLRHSYVYGICLGILMFIRLNNAVTICAMILFWMIVLVGERKWKLLLSHLGIGFLGVASVSIPVFLYFWGAGSLREMIYATFLFNFRYGSEGGFLYRLDSLNTWAHLIILYSPLVLALLVFGSRIRSRRLKTALILVVVLNMITMLFGQGYNHYFTIMVPLEALMCAAFLSGLREKEHNEKVVRSRVVSLAVRVGFAGVTAGYAVLAARIIVLNVKDYYVDDAFRTKYETVQDCLSDIPEEERGSVLGYSVPAEYYLFGDLVPCYRYAILQENWGSVDAKITEDMLQFLSEGKARWIVTLPNGYDSREVAAILERDYELVNENEYCILYRRNTE